MKDVLWQRIAQRHQSGLTSVQERVPFLEQLVGATRYSQWWTIDLDREDAIKLAGSQLVATVIPAAPPEPELVAAPSIPLRQPSARYCDVR